MTSLRNRNFRAGPQTILEGFICRQNSDKQQKIKVFGRSGGVPAKVIGNFDESVKKAAEFSKSFSKDSYIVADLFSQRPIVFDSDNI